jgi:hypothetical protein
MRLRKEIVAVENVIPPGPDPEVTPTAVNDPQHVGDIVGALGTLKRGTANSRSWRRKLRLLLVIMGPGLIVMGGGNDAGGVQVYAQMGQDYGMRLLWTLILLFRPAVGGRGGGVRGTAVRRDGGRDLPVLGAIPGRARDRELRDVPDVFFAHASAAPVASGAVPSLPGGLNATILLLVVAVVGTQARPGDGRPLGARCSPPPGTRPGCGSRPSPPRARRTGRCPWRCSA